MQCFEWRHQHSANKLPLHKSLWVCGAYFMPEWVCSIHNSNILLLAANRAPTFGLSRLGLQSWAQSGTRRVDCFSNIVSFHKLFYGAWSGEAAVVVSAQHRTSSSNTGISFMTLLAWMANLLNWKGIKREQLWPHSGILEGLIKSLNNFTLFSDQNTSPKRYSYTKLLGKFQCCFPR
jgi:hypothetical protein